MLSLAVVFVVGSLSAHAQQEAAPEQPQAIESPATQQEPIRIELTAQRVEKDAEGKESLSPAEEAKPGDTILYTATCENTSDRSLQGIAPVIPIPAGVTLVPDSITPAAKEATTDGSTFVSYPITRTVTTAGGKEESRPAPADAYRAIRWEIAELAAGAKTVVSLRVTVNQTIPTTPTPAPSPANP